MRSRHIAITVQPEPAGHMHTQQRRKRPDSEFSTGENMIRHCARENISTAHLHKPPDQCSDGTKHGDKHTNLGETQSHIHHGGF